MKFSFLGLKKVTVTNSTYFSDDKVRESSEKFILFVRVGNRVYGTETQPGSHQTCLRKHINAKGMSSMTQLLLLF